MIVVFQVHADDSDRMISIAVCFLRCIHYLYLEGGKGDTRLVWKIANPTRSGIPTCPDAVAGQTQGNQHNIKYTPCLH